LKKRKKKEWVLRSRSDLSARESRKRPASRIAPSLIGYEYSRDYLLVSFSSLGDFKCIFLAYSDAKDPFVSVKTIRILSTAISVDTSQKTPASIQG